MNSRTIYSASVAFAVALGGFLMGFDSAVISGVVDPIRSRFELDAAELGWAVSCLTLGATLAMAIAGPAADRFGRRTVLFVTALLFTASAIGSALAPDYTTLVLARIVGGFGVGGALLIAPIFIAEIAPPELRGRLVSFNQLNIVLGFSAAFFSNYFLERHFAGSEGGGADVAWRWMLGVETVPAVLYFVLLMCVPRSPRWLAMKGRDAEALAVLVKANGPERAASALAEVHAAIQRSRELGRVSIGEVVQRRMRRVLLIGLGLGFFQQATGINAIFYYCTTIFSMTGVGRDAALSQAIWVGIVNVVFTVIAMWLIERLGRKPLLLVGTAVMSLALFTNAWTFASATYRLDGDGATATATLEPIVGAEAAAALAPLAGRDFASRTEFFDALAAQGRDSGASVATAIADAREDVAKASMRLDGTLVLLAIMVYIAAFAISLGPVMWAMFSEIFPMRLRGVAISLAGFFNSAVSWTVQQVFPGGLEVLGPGGMFAVFGGFAALGLVFTIFVVPETKGRSLEELEAELIPAA